MLQGCKEKGDNLWTVSANEEEGEEEANNVYTLPSTKQSIRYLHASAGFPVESEWIKAIKAGNYVTWPELTAEAVHKHFPESDETQKGHMKQQRQNVRSTKVKQNATDNGGNDNEDHDDQQFKSKAKHKDVYIKIYLANDTVHFDQTGRFPATSSRGNKYIMVLVEIDGNYIDAEPMKNKTEGSMIKAYLALWERLTATGTVKPTTHIMDNEASAEYKKVIRKNCTIQLVPPNNHRRNLAERAIQTFKSHFIAIIAGVDDTFPMRLWDKLLPQTIVTLNLLRQSNAVPSVSAYQYVRGIFDYNKTPLGPMGSAVQMHESRDNRSTWAERSIDGWYLGTSQEHYRCHIIHVKKTNSERISDTVFFKHKYITQPTLTPVDTVVKAIDDLTCALKGARNTQGMQQIERLKMIDELLNKIPSNLTEMSDPPTKTPIPRVEDIRPGLTPLTFQSPPLNIPETTSEQAPRVQNKNEAKVSEKNKIKAVNRDQIKGNIRNLATRRARIPQRHQMQLRQEQRERAQLIYDKESKEYLKYRQLMRDPKYKETWSKSAANEFGRLAQGVGGRYKGTNTIFFIHKNQVPHDRMKDVMYGSFSCDYKPNKTEKERTRLMAGGDRINYPEDVGTPTADMLVFKCLINSVVSTKGAKCMMLDIKDFYLNVRHVLRTRTHTSHSQ